MKIKFLIIILLSFSTIIFNKAEAISFNRNIAVSTDFNSSYQVDEVNETSSSFAKYLLYFSLFANILFCLYVIFDRSKSNKLLKNNGNLKHDLKATTNKKNIEINASKGEIQQYKEKCTKLEQEIELLLQQVKDNESLINSTLTSVDNEVHDYEINANNDLEKSTAFIAKCVHENDEFYLKESKISNHTTPYIIIEMDNEYYFKFDELNILGKKNAFNFHDVYFEGYCDGINIRTDAHTSFEIVNNSMGRLNKIGDKYLVVERIKVNYLGGY